MKLEKKQKLIFLWKKSNLSNKKVIYFTYLFINYPSQNKSEKNFYVNKWIIKVEGNDKWKEIDIKNYACSHFDDIIKFEDCDLDNILIDKKSYENDLVYNLLYKTLIDAKPWV